MTEEQIAMFANAEEIQKLWKPTLGDAYSIAGVKVYTWIGLMDTGMFWIPNTDQLAEIWGEAKGEGYDSVVFFHGVWQFMLDNPQTPDWEHWPIQLIVLCYVMNSLFSLTWDSENERWGKG